MGRGDGGFATGNFSEGHHVIGRNTLVTGTNIVDSSHLGETDSLIN